MAINFSTLIYDPAQGMFGRPVTFTPRRSQPGFGGSYMGRGIFDTREREVIAEDNSILSDQQTILDIRTIEYPIPPTQGDFVFIDADPDSGVPAEGEFEIIDQSDNGGGERTYVLQKVQTAP